MSAEQTSRAAIAAEQLCAAMWEALHDQLRAGSPEQAAMLAERISDISRSISVLALMPPTEIEHDPPAPGEAPAPSQEPQAPATVPVDLRGERSAPPPGASVERDGGAVLVDEHAAVVDAPIAIRDARAGAAESAWSAVIQRRLDRYLQDRAPFAVLLIELLDAERLRLAQSPVDAERQLRDVEAAMVGQLRPADALVREADGRYWLIAPQTDATVARTVGARIGAAARRSASHRGAPLEVAIGIARCPDHGLDTLALLGHAEVDLYAAEAGGSVLSDPEGDPAA